jgi:hypothetical protein
MIEKNPVLADVIELIPIKKKLGGTDVRPARPAISSVEIR